MTLLVLSLTFLVATNSAPALDTTSPSTERSERIRHTFDDLRSDTLYLLDDLYAEDLVFEDPLGRLDGLDEFRIYIQAMYEYVEEIQWTYTDEVVDGDTHVLFWTMTLQARGLNKGAPFSVEGTSKIVFGAQEKVTFHRDYFDMGDYVYERVPVVKYFVKFVKRRLHKAVESARK